MTTSEKVASEARRLKSECGLYLAERVSGDDWRYTLYDASGKTLGISTFWSNRSTATRIGFEIGVGAISATFSYPRYPQWFRRRWVSCFEIKFDDLRELIEGFGCEVLTGFKPNWHCWHCFGFRATAKQLRQVDDELRRRGVKWNGPPGKSGQWNIDCPSKAREASRARSVGTPA